MNGKVDYFGNSDVYFAFYKGDDEQLDTMPVKDNAEGLVFDHAECDNGANVEWNSEEWGPVVKNLSKSKTKCSLYFDKLGEVELYGKKISLVNSGNGLYKVEHNDIIDEMTEYRYAGSNPNNYISVDDGIWRIIGLVNIQTEYGAEQRIKIIRTKGIEGQQDLGDYSWDYKSSYNNDWTTSTLNTMLNGIYYESGTGECYQGSSIPNTCDFTGENGSVKGLGEFMQIFISSDLMYGYNNIWSLGGMGDYTTKNNGLVTNFYSNERSGIVYPNNPIEWDSNNYLGLMYPSDYGYAVGGNVRTTCLETEMYNWNNETCGSNDWLKPQSGNYWTIMSNDNNPNGVFYISSNGYIRGDADVTNSYGVAPVAYLYEGCISEGDGTIDNPFTYMPVLCGY